VTEKRTPGQLQQFLTRDAANLIMSCFFHLRYEGEKMAPNAIAVGEAVAPSQLVTLNDSDSARRRIVIAQGPIDEDCLFCKTLTMRPHQLPWHDQLLTRVPHVGAVIAGLGAFAPGYVLVFPEQHVKSTLGIPKDDYPLFTDLLAVTIAKVTAAFGPPTIFEHGSCILENTRRSACLDHAHIHLLPGLYELSNSNAQADAAAVPRWQPRVIAAVAGYLFLQEPGAEPIYAADPGISQYFRRKVAAKLDFEDEWDYLLFPRLENVLETIKRFPRE
jgi:diadenosine tetraphosphate (Ap4A) HIT family hydrolase